MIKKKKILYLGLDPARFKGDAEVVHYPIIAIVPLPIHALDLSIFTHCIITSRTTVKLLQEQLLKASHLQFICVGKASAENLPHAQIAKTATGEGIVELLQQMDLSSAHIFYPHSLLSRDLIETYLRENQIKHFSCNVYTTEAITTPLPFSLEDFSEIIFTSPSCVSAFFKLVPKVPEGIRLSPIGPITQACLKKYFASDTVIL